MCALSSVSSLIIQQLAAGVTSVSSACRVGAKQDFFCQQNNYSQQEGHLSTGGPSTLDQPPV